MLPESEHGVLGFGGEDVQAESLGDLLADPDATDAVAELIEPRREHPDAKLGGNDGQDQRR